MRSRLRAIRHETKQSLAAGVIAFGLVTTLAGCHGSWLDSGPKIWYLSSSACADGSARLLLYSPVLSGSKIGGTTGRFYADENGCHPLSSIAGSVSVQPLFELVGSGTCYFGHPALNNGGDYFVNHEELIGYACGSANYRTTTVNDAFVDGAWQGTALHSPTDNYTA